MKNIKQFLDFSYPIVYYLRKGVYLPDLSIMTENKDSVDKVKRGAPPQVWDVSKLQFFLPDIHTPEINQLCIGLTKEEVLDYYGITYDVLPEYDQWYFDITYTRGRTTAKSNAVSKLFTAMKGKDALPASLSYLTRFGEGWVEADNGGSNMPKSIKIVVEE